MFDMGLMKVVFYIVLLSWLNIACVKVSFFKKAQTMVEIYGGTFWETTWTAKTVTYFRQPFHHNSLIES